MTDDQWEEEQVVKARLLKEKAIFVADMCIAFRDGDWLTITANLERIEDIANMPDDFGLAIRNAWERAEVRILENVAPALL